MDGSGDEHANRSTSGDDCDGAACNIEGCTLNLDADTTHDGCQSGAVKPAPTCEESESEPPGDGVEVNDVGCPGREGWAHSLPGPTPGALTTASINITPDPEPSTSMGVARGEAPVKSIACGVKGIQIIKKDTPQRFKSPAGPSGACARVKNPDDFNFKQQPCRRAHNQLDANGNPLPGQQVAQEGGAAGRQRKGERSKNNNPVIPKPSVLPLAAAHKQGDYLFELKEKRRMLYEALLDYESSPERLRNLLGSGISTNMEFSEEEVGRGHQMLVGYSAVHFACTEGSAEMLDDLVRHGADVNKIGRNGESALYYACVGCKLSLVRALLRHNGDINITHKDMGGETPLLATVASYLPGQEPANDYLEIARLLILAGADVNQADYMDITPLYVAVTKADTRMTQLLIDSGAILLVSGNYEYATKLLMRAIDHESEANVRLLISYGCDVNGVSQSHGLAHTPLDLAVVKNNLGIVLDLLIAGASENLNEPLHSAARNKHLVTLLLLIAKGGDVNARNNVDKATLLLTLTRARSVVGVDMLMRLGANPNLENTLGTTPVWAAVRANYPELVKKFIRCNCDLDITSIQHFLYRPIAAVQLALELGYFDMVRWLMQAGCSIRNTWLREHNMPLGLRSNAAMILWLEKCTTSPRSLRFLCRKVLRQSLGFNLFKFLNTMLYPDSLKAYIRLVNLDSETDTIDD